MQGIGGGDPGFYTGASTPKEVANLLFGQIFPKTARKLKLGPERVGASKSCLCRSATDSDRTFCFKEFTEWTFRIYFRRLPKNLYFNDCFLSLVDNNKVNEKFAFCNRSIWWRTDFAHNVNLKYDKLSERIEKQNFPFQKRIPVSLHSRWAYENFYWHEKRMLLLTIFTLKAFFPMFKPYQWQIQDFCDRGGGTSLAAPTLDLTMFMVCGITKCS